MKLGCVCEASTVGVTKAITLIDLDECNGDVTTVDLCRALCFQRMRIPVFAQEQRIQLPLSVSLGAMGDLTRRSGSRRRDAGLLKAIQTQSRLHEALKLLFELLKTYSPVWYQKQRHDQAESAQTDQPCDHAQKSITEVLGARFRDGEWNLLDPQHQQDQSYRRHFPRYRTDLKLTVVVLGPEGHFDIMGLCNQIGEGGLRAITSNELSTGEMVNLQLSISSEPQLISMRAVVRWRDRLQHGFEFVEISAEKRTLIRNYCKDHLTEQSRM